MHLSPRRSFPSHCPWLLLFVLFGASASAAPVLIISIDGLKPEYILQADAHGLKIPNLRTLVSNGTYADGVVGVWPTLTYPSHVTLITGVLPAEHGVYNNVEFDPDGHFGGAWNWYADEIKVPTLWHAAHNAGLHTASIGWPVSVGARDVDWLIPEYWRADYATASNPLDGLLIAALSHPRTLLSELEPAAGPYMMGNDASIAGDETKTRYALEILRKDKPALMTLHLSALDEVQHEHGVFSAEADHTLEAIDGMVARLATQEFANNPSAVLLIVSDHGFLNIARVVNLQIPFVQAGLMPAGPGAWKARPWMAGGMAAIMLRDPNDRATVQKVQAILNTLAADPSNGIAQVLEREAIAKRGCFPDAAFVVVLSPGYYAGFATSGRLVQINDSHLGAHGYPPDYPEMRASFFALGAGVAHHRDLGLIDMRQVAPTAARILGAPMPSARAEPLRLKP